MLPTDENKQLTTAFGHCIKDLYCSKSIDLLFRPKQTCATSLLSKFFAIGKGEGVHFFFTFDLTIFSCQYESTRALISIPFTREAQNSDTIPREGFDVTKFNQ